MKLLLVLVIVIALASARSLTDDDDWSKPTKVTGAQVPRSAPAVVPEEDFAELPMEDNVGPPVTEMIEEVVEEEVEEVVTTTTTTTTTMKPSSTRRSAKKTTTTTTTAKPVVVMAQIETSEPTTEKAKSIRKPAVNRSRPGSLTRGKPASKIEDLPVEEDVLIESTSPASVDTASVAIKAPSKSFRPTSKPVEEENPKDLMDFLRRRKIERIAATTTVDPFVAILATATPPSTEETATFAVEKSNSGSGRFSSSGSSRRLPTTSSRRGSARKPQTMVTTTTTTEVSAPVVAAASPARISASRFASRRASTTTTTIQPTIDEPAVVETSSARSQLVPKRPVAFRPVGNSILRRRDQTTTTTTTTEAQPQDDEIEDLEVTTRRSFRRASGRLLPFRSNGV